MSYVINIELVFVLVCHFGCAGLFKIVWLFVRDVIVLVGVVSG